MGSVAQLIRILSSVLSIACAAAAIVFDRGGRMPAARACRVAAMALVTAVAALGAAPFRRGDGRFVLLGLLFCFAGDVLMMLPRKRFTEGLAAFLAAQVPFVLAFRGSPPVRLAFGTLLPFLVLGLLLFRLVSPGLGGLKFPVFVYAMALTFAAALAANRFVELGGRSAFLAFAGMLLFFASDAVLAFNRFSRPVAGAQALILGTFYPAMVLVALSA